MENAEPSNAFYFILSTRKPSLPSGKEKNKPRQNGMRPTMTREIGYLQMSSSLQASTDYLLDR
jgi:hypothetical protein